MRPKPTTALFALFALTSIALLWSWPVAAQTLDDSCVVSALNRSTRALADGSWVLPNVPSNFGAIRVRANCVDGGVTRAGQSGLVRLPPGGTLEVADIVFDAPRPIPARLTLRSPRAVLGSTGESVQLEAVASFASGATADVTASATGTDYRSSNPAVLSVSADGVATAIASGTVLVSATHDGTLGVVQLTVIAAVDSDGDGLPDDFEIANGLDPLVAADAQLDPDGDRLSIGEEFRRGTDPFDADTDGDGLDDGREARELQTDALRFDTDGDGLSDGLEVELGTDPIDPASFDYASALVSLEVRPGAFAIVFDTVLGDASAQLQVVGAVRDGSSIDLTGASRGTTYHSSDLAVCRLGVEPGRIFAGQPGDCTITVANAGHAASARGLVQTFSPRLLASVAIPGSANAIEVVDDHAFVAAGSAGLQVVDVADRRVPSIVGSIATLGAAADVAVAGGVAVVGAGAGLELIDVSSAAQPRRLATVPLGATARGVAVAGALAAAVADSGAERLLSIIDIAVPSAPRLAATAATSGAPRAVALDAGGELAVVAEGALGVEVFDLTDPTRPLARGRASTGDARAIVLDGGFALVADALASLTVVDVRDPSSPRVVGALARDLGGIPIDVARFGALAFTADLGFFAEKAVPIFDVSDPTAPLARARMALPTAHPGRGVDADAAHVYLIACGGCDGAAHGDSHLDIGQYQTLRDELGRAPQVALSSPHDGDVIAAGSSLQITADASDDVGVLAVELLADGAVVGRDERPPYGAIFAVPVDADRLRLGARAFDFAANPALAAEIELLVARAGITTVTGSVIGPGEQPVPGARVVIGAAASAPGATGAAASAVTGIDGRFVVADLAVAAEALQARASAAVDGTKHRGSSAAVLPVVGGTTDLGAIELDPIDVLYPGPRSSTGLAAQSMAGADFDGDGIGDLAVMHSVSASGLVILAGRADGRFVLRQRLAIPNGVLAAGDLTLDGAPDLVVGIAGGHALVLRNDGAGGFAVVEDHAVGTTAASPRIGDFDGDGSPDVLFAGVVNRNLALVFGNGDGTLRSGPLVSLPGTPEDTVIGDFDLDGRLDAAVATTSAAAPHAVVVFRGDGAGGLIGSATLSFSLPPVRIAAGDFDGDGRLDLVVGAGRDDGARAFVALGNGDGAFALQSTLGTALVGWPIAMAAADLDADGALDLAVGRSRPTCNDILLLGGDGAGSFAADHSRVITDRCGDLPRLHLSDQTADGLPEVLALDTTGVTTYLGLGALAFERRSDLLTAKAVERVASADLDSDGRPDLVYSLDASKSFGVQLGNGDGTFRATADRTTSVFIDQLAAGDLDRDGDVDLAIASLDEVGVLLGNGDGTFAAALLRPIDRLLSSLQVADVSGDGAGDVIATNGATDQLVVYESRGDGTLENGAANLVGDSPQAAVIADLDRDGRVDVAVANGGSDDVSVLLGTGGGGFAPQVRYAVEDQPLSVAAADLDLDGDLDLIAGGGSSTASSSGPNLVVLLGDGRGSFIPQPRISPPVFAVHHVAADVDLDGVPDLVLVHGSTNELSLLLGEGDGTFLPAERSRTGHFPWRLTIADLDGDGAPDLITANLGTNSRPGISVLHHR